MAEKSIQELLQPLIDALEKGDYSVKPGKLREGCVYALTENPDGTLRAPTEEELDVIYEQARKEREHG